MDDLVAFAEVVLGSAPLPPRSAHTWSITSATSSRGPDGYYLSAYRTTIDLLRQLAGARFAVWNRERTALVARYRLGSPLVSPDEELGPFPDAARTVRPGRR